MALRVKPDNYQPPAEEEIPVEEVPMEEPDDMGSMLPMASGGQVDPEAARYFGREYMCQGCIHFMEPGTCEIVAGEIDPEGICSLFVPDAAEVEASIPTADPMMGADVPETEIPSDE